jgi:hypothetical protein
MIDEEEIKLRGDDLVVIYSNSPPILWGRTT